MRPTIFIKNRKFPFQNKTGPGQIRTYGLCRPRCSYCLQAVCQIYQKNSNSLRTKVPTEVQLNSSYYLVISNGKNCLVLGSKTLAYRNGKKNPRLCFYFVLIVNKFKNSKRYVDHNRNMVRTHRRNICRAQSNGLSHYSDQLKQL